MDPIPLFFIQSVFFKFHIKDNPSFQSTIEETDDAFSLSVWSRELLRLCDTD